MQCWQERGGRAKVSLRPCFECNMRRCVSACKPWPAGAKDDGKLGEFREEELPEVGVGAEREVVVGEEVRGGANGCVVQIRYGDGPSLAFAKSKFQCFQEGVVGHGKCDVVRRTGA